MNRGGFDCRSGCTAVYNGNTGMNIVKLTGEESEHLSRLCDGTRLSENFTADFNECVGGNYRDSLPGEMIYKRLPP